MKASGELKSDADTALFGECREFLQPRSRTQDRTPLVNNIVAAHVFTDQDGRVYAYADPLDDDEHDPESKWVPWVPVTDRLFVAITNQSRQTDDGQLALPQPNDVLMLQRRGTRHSMRVVVDAVQEPSAQRQRVSSALITLTELVPVGRTDSLTAHAFFENAVRSLQAS